mmetsp:Transcript_25664/g.38588  ORF Transcript_25664/g.38588 Transcript_25664/m.38588 type:complete len:98 (+) Transcript_25664:281-574(+)
MDHPERKAKIEAFNIISIACSTTKRLSSLGLCSYSLGCHQHLHSTFILKTLSQEVMEFHLRHDGALKQRFFLIMTNQRQIGQPTNFCLASISIETSR